MSQPELMVIGAGPVGLMMACEASRHGMSVRIIDQSASASIHSKAQIIHARTLEIFEDMGLVGRVLERGIPINSIKIFEHRAKERLANLVIAGNGSHYEGLWSISQHDTEALLAEALSELGVEVEREVRLQGLEQDADGVRATLKHLTRDEEEVVSVPWVVGCDGAHSTVRHALELPFEGEAYKLHFIQADARVDFPFEAHSDETIAMLGRGQIALFFPLAGGERRYRFLVPTTRHYLAKPKLEDFQAILDEIAAPGSRVSDPRWMVAFDIHRRQVPRYREGRVFLAGDAAHVHSPFGGQGMNLGLQDAYNLAWKLALVHRGEGRDRLLDSYSSERHPVGARVLEWTDRATKGVSFNFKFTSAIATYVRSHVAATMASFGFVQRTASRVVSMLDHGYERSPICGEARASLARVQLSLDESNESPDLMAWRTFSLGPRPGYRAPNASTLPGSPDGVELFSLFHGTHHTLLLFDGVAATGEGYVELSAIRDRVRARYGDQIRTYLVVPGESAPAGLPDDLELVLDPHSELHGAYGATTECIYLVRPDEHIGFRSQPADAAALLEHLEGVLVHS
jgi:2-polyprenyl-6-methoxyphenol hydroxylase-like FAD-dependent oxidoreductase